MILPRLSSLMLSSGWCVVLTDTVVAELVAQKPRVEPMPMSEVEQGHSIATLNRRGAR